MFDGLYFYRIKPSINNELYSYFEEKFTSTFSLNIHYFLRTSLLPSFVCPLDLPNSWPPKIGIIKWSLSSFPEINVKKRFHIYTMFDIYIFRLTRIKEMLSVKYRKETRIQYNTGRSALYGQYLLVHLALLSIIPPGIYKSPLKSMKKSCVGGCEDLVWQPVEVIICYFPISSDPSWRANFAHQVCPSLWIKYSQSYQTIHICVVCDLWKKYSHSYKTIHIFVTWKSN